MSAGTAPSGLPGLAGSWDLGGADPAGLAPVLGDAATSPRTARDGPLSIAWTGIESGGAGGVRCVLDGRLANLPALRAELGLPPTAGPADAVAAGFARWGDDLPRQLRGEFAFAAWDGERRRGLLARDPLGARGMFLAGSPGDLRFASEVRTLLRMLPRRPAPDELAVAHWLERTAPESDATLYAGVRRLRPGHRLALGDPGAAPEAWWPPPWSAPAALAPGEVEEALRAGMHHAVHRALAGARRPGVLLSGGFDSAAVAALAGNAHAYSMTFPAHPEIDESARIDRVVEHAGLPATRLEFAGGSALATAREDLAAWELPPVSPNRFVWAPLLRRARADGAGVLLGGDGGDELFGVSPYLIADRLRHGRALSALDLARRLPGMGDRPPARLVRRALVRYGARGALAPGLHARLRRARQRGTPAHDPWAWKRRPGPRWHAWLAHTLTTGADALGAPDHFRHEAALAGIAVRHPWRDPDLVAAVLALPPESAFDAHLDRPAARRAMAGLVPDEVRLDDRKPHFNRLLEESLERDRAPARALLESAEVAAYLEPAALRDLAAALAGAPAARRPGWALDAWRALTLESWLRMQRDGLPPDITVLA